MNLMQMLSRRKPGGGNLPANVFNEPALAKIAHWENIYAGNGEWRYVRKGGIDGGTRRVASLGAAKSLCQELAGLCFSQQADFYFKNDAVKKYVLKTLQDNGFWRCFPLFLEKMFALGSGVIKTYVEGGKIKLDFLGADSFIPTQYDEQNVYGGVIMSGVRDGGKDFLLLERHEKSGGDYIITNLLLDDRGKERSLAEYLPGLEAGVKVRGLKRPLFVYFRPAVANNISGDPLGISVFANAVDLIKALDVALDSLEREFVLGRKRIIVPTSALRGEYNEKGELKRYFDTSDEVYQAFSPDDKEELKIIDNSTELRITQHAEAIDALLDLLCMQVGLSQGTFAYRSGAAKTATEILSAGSKTYRTKSAHQQLIRESLIDLCANIVLLAQVKGDLPVLPESETAAEVVFADGVMADNSAKIDNAVKLYSAGLVSREKALEEIYGIDETTKID